MIWFTLLILLGITIIMFAQWFHFLQSVSESKWFTDGFAIILGWLKQGEPIGHHGYILAASATILALTSFGSILGVRISKDRVTVQTQAKGFIFILGGAVAITITQALIMGATCCNELHSVAYLTLLAVTALYLICMIVGYAIVIRAYIDETQRKSVIDEKINATKDPDSPATPTGVL